MKNNVKSVLSKHILEIILVVLFLIMTITSDHFIKPGNLLNILRDISMTGIVAFGMTFVIIAGEIDLSVGSTVALSGVVTAYVTGKLSSAGIMPMESAVIVGMIVAILGSVLIGLFNGILLTKFKMPSFIITLGMLNLLYGLAAVISSGFPITTLPKWYSIFGAGTIGSIMPVSALFLIIVFLISFVTLKYMKFGRAVYATGGNLESARLSGINVNKIKILVMTIVQVCSAISGILLSSQVMSGTFSFAKGWEMTAISAVIIGGASLSGGKGTASGTLLGLLFLGIIGNAMTLNGVDEYMQYIVQGALILIAVLINSLQNNKKN